MAGAMDKPRAPSDADSIRNRSGRSDRRHTKSQAAANELRSSARRSDFDCKSRVGMSSVAGSDVASHLEPDESSSERPALESSQRDRMKREREAFPIARVVPKIRTEDVPDSRRKRRSAERQMHYDLGTFPNRFGARLRLVRPNSGVDPKTIHFLPSMGEARSVLLGRSSKNADVFVYVEEHGSFLSRKHAVFEYDGARWLVRDVGSVNGVFVNSNKLVPDKLMQLKHRDRVFFGNPHHSFFLEFEFLENTRSPWILESAAAVVASPAEDSFDFPNIPPENVLQFLDLKTVNRIASVSRRYAWNVNRFVTRLESIVWRHYWPYEALERLLERQDLGLGRLKRLSLSGCCLLSQDQLKMLSTKWGSELRRLDLDGIVDLVPDVMDGVAKTCTKLEVINVRGSKNVAEANRQALPRDNKLRWAQSVPQNNPNLRVLDVGSINIAMNSLQTLATFSPNLEELNVGVMGGNGCTDGSLMHIARSCPKLKRIDLRGCRAITSRGIRALARLTNSNLEEVVVHCCAVATNEPHRGRTGVWDECLNELAMHCPNLKLLNAHRCSAITDDGVIRLATECEKLETLDLSGTKITDVALKAVGEHLSNLKHLDLRACKYVSAEGVSAVFSKCSKLETVDLCGCQRIGRSKLLELMCVVPFSLKEIEIGVGRPSSDDDVVDHETFVKVNDLIRRRFQEAGRTEQQNVLVHWVGRARYDDDVGVLMQTKEGATTTTPQKPTLPTPVKPERKSVRRRTTRSEERDWKRRRLTAYGLNMSNAYAPEESDDEFDNQI